MAANPISSPEELSIQMNLEEWRLGREKQQSRAFQIDFASKTNIHKILDSLIEQSRISNSSLQVHLSIFNGGIAGLEYIETQKIRTNEKNS